MIVNVYSNPSLMFAVKFSSRSFFVFSVIHPVNISCVDMHMSFLLVNFSSDRPFTRVNILFKVKLLRKIVRSLYKKTTVELI